MGFSRQEYWTRLPYPSPGDLLNPGIERMSPAFLAGGFFTTESPGKPNFLVSDVSVSVLITLSICCHLCIYMGMYIYNLFIISSYLLFYLYIFSVYFCLLQSVFYYWSVLFLLSLPSYISIVGRRTVKILGKVWQGRFLLRRCSLSKGLKEGREGVVGNLEWEHHRQRLLQRQKAWCFKGDQERETEWVRGGKT